MSTCNFNNLKTKSFYTLKIPDVKSEKALEPDKLGFKSLLIPFPAWCPQISYSAAEVEHEMEIIIHA